MALRLSLPWISVLPARVSKPLSLLDTCHISGVEASSRSKFGILRMQWEWVRPTHPFSQLARFPSCDFTSTLQGQLLPMFFVLQKITFCPQGQKTERFLNYSLEQTYFPNSQPQFKGCHWLCIRTMPHWNQSVGPTTKWNTLMGFSVLDRLTLCALSLCEKIKRKTKMTSRSAVSGRRVCTPGHLL